MYISKLLRQKNNYSRINAVKYATTYALTPNPNYRYFDIIDNKGGDCANFISQCLLAGGAPMDFNAKYPWWYINSSSSTINDSWSICWAVAHSLYYYLKVNEENHSSKLKGLEVYNTNDLEIGDLIFFEDRNKTIFHSSIITSFWGNNPLISQHTFNALNIPYEKSWDVYKYHFIKIIL